MGPARGALLLGGVVQSPPKTARTPAAPDDGRLWLLRSSSDQVHGPPVHRARPSSGGTGRGSYHRRKLSAHARPCSSAENRRVAATPPRRRADRVAAGTGEPAA